MTHDLSEVARRVAEFRLHPLGFFYLLDDVGQGVTRRVHVWLPDRTSRVDNDCHQHSFDIESLVVVGKMHSDLYRFRVTSDGSELEFAVNYEAGKSMLQPTGRRGVLDLIASFETGTGDRYQLAAGVVHRVLVKERPCVSILTTSERKIPIYSYGVANEQPFVRRRPNREEAFAITAVISAARLP